MEPHATFDNGNIKYAKITLKVRNMLSLEAPTTHSINFGEEPICFQSIQEASYQTINGQTNSQKVQGRRNLL